MEHFLYKIYFLLQKKTSAQCRGLLKLHDINYAFTRSFKALPALNLGALEASIFIVAPV